MIDSPTRITKTSTSLLDLVKTNNKSKITESGVVHVQISDHSLVYVISRKTVRKMRSRKLYFRSLRHFDRDMFLADLHTVPFGVMDIFDDVDDKLFVFETLFTEVLDEHAPLKEFHVRGNQVPYMTEEWRKAIRYRNRLWKILTRDRTDNNYERYKAQRNTCTSLRRKAIREFFSKKAQANNPREFWKTYQPFLHSSNSKPANDITLIEKDTVFTDKCQIAELFNEHFVHTADGVGEIKARPWKKL